MSRARRNASSPVQLFPFLAVLVSTIGALVLLLLAINRQATLHTMAKSVAELMKQTSSEEESLAIRRQELQREIAVLRGKLGAVESSERSVEQQFLQSDDRLRSKAEQARAAWQQLDHIRSERELIEPQIQAIRDKIEVLQVAKARFNAEQKNADRTFVPVIHPGANGTARRPIYMECTAEAVILQPEGIALPPKALEPDGTGENPLARAVRILGGYYAARDSTSGQPEHNIDAQPYPLLLVRPSGISAYYAAREALESLGLSFGYELIEKDWLLSYPDPDPKARELAMAASRIRPRQTGAGGSRSVLAGPLAGSTHMPRRGGIGAPHQTEESSVGLPGNSSVVQEDATLSQPLIGRGSSEEGTSRVDKHRSSDGSLVLNEGPEENAEVPRNVPSSDELPPTEWQSAVQSPSHKKRTIATRSSAGSDQKPFEDQEPGGSPGSRSRTRRVATSAPAGAGEVPGPSLPGNPAMVGRIPIPRKVRIECMADRWVVGSKDVVIPVPGSGSLDEVMWQVREAMEREVASWGTPGMNFLWEPHLYCQVQGDALDTFYRLRLALADSSIPIDHVIVAEDKLDLNETEFLKSEASKVRSRDSFGSQRITLNAQRFLE